jgi:probable rRNA maturation factor
MNSDPLITFRRKPATLDVPSLFSFAETLRAGVARGREFHCLMTNDAELQALNAQFRGKNYPTDVLSFPGVMDQSLGDVAISMQRARAQAREWRHTVEDELRILMLHGVLHLRGMDHETDAGQMKRAEIRWRRKLGLPVSLIERETA